MGSFCLNINVQFDVKLKTYEGNFTSASQIYKLCCIVYEGREKDRTFSI